MRPILFHVWKVPVYSYGFSLACAFVIAALVATRLAKRYKVSADNVIDLALYTCVAAIIGSRLAYIIIDLPTYIANPKSIIALKDGGLSYFGGLASAIAVGVWYCRRYRISVPVMADIAAPLVALGYSLVRVGCLLNGCCYGAPSDLPWAFACAAYDSTRRHPTQVYAALASLVIFFILLLLGRDRRFKGKLLVAYVGLYSVARFVIEIFRVVPRFIGPLSLAQVVSIVLAAGSAVTLWVLVGGEGQPAVAPAEGRRSAGAGSGPAAGAGGGAGKEVMS